MSQVPIPVAVRGGTRAKEQAIKLPNADESNNRGLEAPWFLPTLVGLPPTHLCAAKSNAKLSIYFTMILGDKYFRIIGTHFPRRILQNSETSRTSSKNPKLSLGEEVSPLGNPGKFWLLYEKL